MQINKHKEITIIVNKSKDLSLLSKHSNKAASIKDSN